MKVLAIDQSYTPGLCLTDDMSPSASPVILETFDTGKAVGYNRSIAIIDRIMGIVKEHKPDVIAYENLDFTAATSSIGQMAEITGTVKYLLKKNFDYTMGYGTPHTDEERQECRDAMLMAGPLRVVVAQSSGGMKKFCLGKGNLRKDTKYLLTIKNKLGITFGDDNQADAFMHAKMAHTVVGVMRGVIPMSNLEPHQQEAIFTANGSKSHLPKGMSVKKALALPDADKLQLVTL